MNKRKKRTILGLIICTLLLIGTVIVSTAATFTSSSTNNSITVHFKSQWENPNVYYWNSLPDNITTDWPGKAMTSEGNGWYSYKFENVNKINFNFNKDGNQTDDLTRNSGEWWYKDGQWYNSNPDPVIPATTTPGTTTTVTPSTRTDFRDETIYFVMTTRFFDGYKDNNVHCWDDKKAGNPDSDPAWRGDFQGLIDKLDYIKAMGFSAIWITPVVENCSGYDYHGYHAINFSKVDPRYESPGATYQDLINAVHAKGMKVIQDIVLNHTGNFGEENLMPMFDKVGDLGKESCLQPKSNSGLPANYATLTPDAQYQARLALMKNTDGVNHDTQNIYHHFGNFNWDDYTSQLAQIAGDCVDLNTENPKVYNYLINSYDKYIDMGVDAFRIDTTKHINRLTFNETFIPGFKKEGGDNFYMFGEVAARGRDVWYRGTPSLSPQFYTWKESKDYPWSQTDPDINLASTKQDFADNGQDYSALDKQPTSDNTLLNGNIYHTPDTSKASGLNTIDFQMHWNFANAKDAFGVALAEDKTYNDSTWNVTYVDSHDYAPDTAPESERFNQPEDTWAENLNLMFTFRGIPCLYYGSEIQFMKGAPIDVGPNAPLSTTGRAYYGDKIEGSVNVTDFAKYSNATGAMADTLNHPLAKHIQRLNLIRRAIPALRKGQYSTEGVTGDMAFKRRYTDASTGTDSFAVISITSAATFKGIPNGKYVDAITGDVKNVTDGTLSIPATAKGDMRIYVLDLGGNNGISGQIGETGKYLK